MNFFEQPLFISKLDHALEKMGIVIDAKKKEQLYEYCILFFKWNRAYNLSAIREPQEFLVKHIFDSISVTPFIDATDIIDVGTGGGLPGIPLAIMFPEKKITLLDSAGKKTRFLFQVKTQLKLNNVSVHHCRVEQFDALAHNQTSNLFDAVISRAFASLKDMTDSCQHLLNDNGVFYAMKGIYPQDELNQIVFESSPNNHCSHSSLQKNVKKLSESAKRYIVHAYHKIVVPELDAKRCLIVLKKAF